MNTPLVRIVVLLWLLAVPNLARAQSEDPDDEFNKQRYDQAMAELKKAATETERFSALGPAAKESFNQGKDADAKSFAQELERITPRYKTDWNYGNAVQDFNVVLGRLALKAGNVEAAKARLLAAGRSPGSPQMSTFGPNMSLAEDLFLKGEKAVVLEYFKLCRNFWKSGGESLDTWTKDVSENRLPDFRSNLIY